MEADLSHRVAIVTGAGRGLGESIARTLAAAGARVAVNDINPDRAERVAVAIREGGGEAIGVAADVSNKFQCVSLVEMTRETWGRLDILVNNAAVRPRSSILRMDEWDWTRCLDVNLKAVFFMSQLVGRVMADENADRGGVIVNIGDTAGIAGTVPERSAYVASKAGLVGFARECAREFAAFGVRVNTVIPGVLASPAPKSAHSGAESIEHGQPEAAAGQPGVLDEVARLVLHLCSDAASDITGSVLMADGAHLPR